MEHHSSRHQATGIIPQSMLAMYVWDLEACTFYKLQLTETHWPTIHWNDDYEQSIAMVGTTADERMPKRMLFGKLQTARPQGGAKQRWKDCLLADLRFMGLENGWTQVATQRDKWHARTREAVTKWESEKNRNMRRRKQG